MLLLLEVLSKQKLPQPALGKLPVHRLENVGNALRCGARFRETRKSGWLLTRALPSFLRANKIKLDTTGPEDIVDGNSRLTLVRRCRPAAQASAPHRHAHGV